MDVKFDENTDPLFAVLSPSCYEYHPSGEEFHLKEKDKNGRADVTVCSDWPCFVVKADKISFPFLFLGNTEKEGERPKEVRQSADYLVFLFDGQTGQWTLHIFEMTVKINWYKWDGEGGRYQSGGSDDDARKIQNQFNGGLIRAHGILGVLRGTGFRRVYLHCAYRRAEDLSELRTRKGGPAPRDYLKEPVSLPYYSLPVTGTAYVPAAELRNAPLKLAVETRGEAKIGVGSVRLGI